jgi:transcriptional regulator GlxA family with amidase domain
VIVPACRSVHEHQPPELVAAVRAAYDNGARIASLCSGAFVLAGAGILDGRPATTHWLHAETLAQTFPKVRVDASVLYIDDGNGLTSAGTAAGLDLCLTSSAATTAPPSPTPWPNASSCPPTAPVVRRNTSRPASPPRTLTT